MTTKKFIASVQYGDFEGTINADRADKNDAYDWLESKDLINKNEFIVGITMDVGEIRNGYKDPVYVTFLLTEPRNYDTVKSQVDSDPEPIEVRKVSTEMKIGKFLGLFKRLNIALSPHGMLNNKEYTYTE